MNPNTLYICQTVVALLANTSCHTATTYVSPTEITRVTRRRRPSKQARQIEFVLTLGKPDSEERKFIKRCQKAEEPFPVRNIQLKLYPGEK